MTADQTHNPTAEAAARDLYEGLLVAWNERDAEGFAAPFGDDGAMIGFDGSQAAGREDVFGHLSPVFRDHPTGRYVAKVTSIRAIGDVALYVARWRLRGTDPSGAPVVLGGESTDVLRRQPDGRWLIALDNPWGPALLQSPP